MRDTFTRDVLRAVHDRSRVPGAAGADAYTVLVGLFLVVGMLLSLIRRDFTAHTGTLDPINGCAMAGVWAAGVLYLCCAVGPAYAQRSYARWLLSTPLDRSTLLAPGFIRTAGSAAAAGAVGGALTSVAIFGAAASVSSIVWGVVGGAVTGFDLHQVALLVQHRGRGMIALRRASAGGVLIGCLGIAVPAHGLTTGVTAGVGSTIAVAWLILVGVFALWSGMRSPSWLGDLSTPTLTRGGDLISAVTGAVVMLDAESLAIHAERQELSRRGCYRSRRSIGSPLIDVVIRDGVGCLRRIHALAPRFALAVTVWALGALFGTGIAVYGCGVVAYLVGSCASLKLQTWLGSTSVWMTMPQHPAAVTAALCVAPTILAAGTGALCALTGALPVGIAGTTGFAVTAGIVRRTYRPPLQMGVMISTPAGALPLGLIRNVTYGLDLTATCLAAGLLFGWAISAPIAALCLLSTLIRAKPGGRKRTALPSTICLRLQRLGIPVRTP